MDLYVVLHVFQRWIFYLELKVGWILFCSVLGLCAVGCYVHTYMHTYMHLGSWIFCVGSYLYSYAVVIDVVNIGSFLHHVGSYQSHCIGIRSFIVAAIGLKNSFLNECISLISLLENPISPPQGPSRASERRNTSLAFCIWKSYESGGP